MLPRSSRLNARFAETFVVTRSDSLLFYASYNFILPVNSLHVVTYSFLSFIQKVLQSSTSTISKLVETSRRKKHFEYVEKFYFFKS